MVLYRCFNSIKLPRRVWITLIVIMSAGLLVLYETDSLRHVVKVKTKMIAPLQANMAHMFNTGDADQGNNAVQKDNKAKEIISRKLLNQSVKTEDKELEEEDDEIEIEQDKTNNAKISHKDDTNEKDDKNNIKNINQNEKSLLLQDRNSLTQGGSADKNAVVKVENLEKDGETTEKKAEGATQSQDETTEKEEIEAQVQEKGTQIQEKVAQVQEKGTQVQEKTTQKEEKTTQIEVKQTNVIANNPNNIILTKTEESSSKGGASTKEGQRIAGQSAAELLAKRTELNHGRNITNPTGMVKTSSTTTTQAAKKLKTHQEAILRMQQKIQQARHAYDYARRPTNQGGTLGKARVRPYSLFDDPIKRAVTPSSGEPWPKPKLMHQSQLTYKVNAMNFKFIASVAALSQCDILTEAIKRYKKEIEQFHVYNQQLNKAGAKLYTKNEPNAYLNLLNVTILLQESQCTGVYPPMQMDESYSITLKGHHHEISAKTIWGVLRGLETFYQLLYIPKTYDERLHVQGVEIQDTPAHWYRGVLVDTARHYLTMDTIKQNLDAMSQNKMNVMHWHIVDDNSFPYKSEAFPDLSRKGAYAPHLVYSQADILEIANFARLRGIRVMPEFDSPGHTRGWLGQPGLLASCGADKEKMTGVFDVTNEKNYDFLHKFFSEVRTFFKDAMIHLGGDEVSMKCWYMNETILKHLQNYTHHELLNKYFSRFHEILFSIDKNWTTIVWEEVDLNYKVKLDPRHTVIEVWNNAAEIRNALSKGFNVVVAKCWYLDHYRGDTADWKGYYDCDPYTFLPGSRSSTSGYSGKIIGGEACMWAEWVDDNNVIPRLWPRAQAPAEKLWSHIQESSYSQNVQARFQEQACRMWRRGIKVSPHNGPGHCSGHMPFDKDLTQFQNQVPR